MGLDIKINKKGEYQITSTVSDERLHTEKWVSEDEAKRIMIYRKFWEFIESTIKIDMTFPNGYVVNDKRHHDESKPNYNQFMLDCYNSNDVDKAINTKFEEIYKRLKLEIEI